LTYPLLLITFAAHKTHIFTDPHNLKNKIMKRINCWIYMLGILGVIMLTQSSCKDENEPVPVLETFPVLYVSQTSVTCEGTITSDGGLEIIEQGVCWSTTPNPTIADNKITSGSRSVSFTCPVVGLTTNTQYYMRAYATSSAGTGYGNVVAFRTWNLEMVTDIDNNAYHTVTIGSQVWLVENLKVTHYRNGTGIPVVLDNGFWEGLTSGAFCDYNNDPGNVAVYGRLYNWFAVNDNNGLAPTGWHVATDADWTTLTTYLGGEDVAGGKLKEAGTEHWLEPNSEATNETGFSALPGGHREYGGTYDYMYWGGGWWTSTSENDNDSWVRYMDHGAFDVWRSLEDKRYGRSVRCVKD
jgi:uncharacterized protein (TIGR02145 family)